LAGSGLGEYGFAKQIIKREASASLSFFYFF